MIGRIALALVLMIVATPAIALEARSFPRATVPYAPTLAINLAGLVAGSLHIRHQTGQVIIEAASWQGVNLSAVQAQVDAALADSAAMHAKYAVDGVQGLAPCLIEAMTRALLPVLNDARQNPLLIRSVITEDQARSNLKAQIDTLGCGL